jgi:hypothetical protein
MVTAEFPVQQSRANNLLIKRFNGAKKEAAFENNLRYPSREL